MHCEMKIPKNMLMPESGIGGSFFPIDWIVLQYCSGYICMTHPVPRESYDIFLLSAGCIESSGISHCSSKSIVQQTIGRLKIDAAKLTIFSQIPQYFLLGLSEVFTGLTGISPCLLS